MSTEAIQLAHGGGGRLMRDLIQHEIVARCGGSALRELPDSALLPPPAGAGLLFTTDSFVVQPLEFPGGDIGRLAVYGTINDLAVCGGEPRWLSLGLILEEGLELARLRRLLDSVSQAARECGVEVVTGDTKVVARGQCDGLYINTAGIGVRWPEFDLGPHRLQPGDHVLVSGTIADHGLAVLAARQGLGRGDGPLSDAAPVHRLVAAVRGCAAGIRYMRDPTRGGLAAVLNEAVEGRAVGVTLREQALPLAPATRGLAEMLGLDPLHVASEGRVVLFCAPGISAEILALWQTLPEGRGAAHIGVVTEESGCVVLETGIGGRRLVDLPRGELLPRIC